MTSNLHFTEEDWVRIIRDYTAWWDGELDRPLLVIHGREPDAPDTDYNRFLANHPDRSAEEICSLVDADLRTQHFFGDAFPCLFVNFGPGALAAFLGANVIAQPETVWFEPAEPLDIRDIDPVFDPDNAYWRRVLDITQTAVDYWNGKVAVSHTDIGGNLDVIASLRGTQPLLTDLLDAPDEVERLVWKVCGHWRDCYDQLDDIIRPACHGTVPWAQSWSPRRTYMMQCDFCYMISPDMFKRFVQPELAAVSASLDDPFYHLDGPGALPHLDLLIEIDDLKGIQWIPGSGNPTADEWPDVLKRIRDGGKLCQIHCSPEGVLNVVRQLGGKGFQFLVTQQMTRDEATAFIREVSRKR